jgi:hypothetical protein
MHTDLRHLKVKIHLRFLFSLSHCASDGAKQRFVCADRVCQRARKRNQQLQLADLKIRH